MKRYELCILIMIFLFVGGQSYGDEIKQEEITTSKLNVE